MAHSKRTLVSKVRENLSMGGAWFELANSGNQGLRESRLGIATSYLNKAIQGMYGRNWMKGEVE